jgi:hypothetical protein
MPEATVTQPCDGRQYEDETGQDAPVEVIWSTTASAIRPGLVQPNTVLERRQPFATSGHPKR